MDRNNDGRQICTGANNKALLSDTGTIFTNALPSLNNDKIPLSLRIGYLRTFKDRRIT